MAGMEPQVRYVKTSDGVNIAYYAIGAGPPFVWPATPWGAGVGNHWRIAELRGALETIARTATLVCYDPRGFGLSDRGPMDYSCEAFVRDLEAVADVAAPTPFVAQTFSFQSMPALVYAARHPERVSALILLNGMLRASDTNPSWRQLVRVARDDWNWAKVLLVRMNEAGYAETASVNQAQDVFDQSVERDAFLAFAGALEDWDASDVAGDVHAPALVAHYGAQSTLLSLDACRRLATALPRATFASVEPTASEEPRVARASIIIRQFLRGALGPREHREAPEASAFPAGTAVILFTDIADSTALTERLGDAAFRERSRALDAAVRAAIRDAGGTAVEGKVLGDGVMGVFASAAQAIAAARRCAEAAGAASMPLHIGLHAGDVQSEDGNVYGGAVNIASRICGLCAPGEILVSQTVRDLARTSAGATFEDRGEQQLRGIGDPVRVFAVMDP